MFRVYVIQVYICGKMSTDSLQRKEVSMYISVNGGWGQVDILKEGSQGFHLTPKAIDG